MSTSMTLHRLPALLPRHPGRTFAKSLLKSQVSASGDFRNSHKPQTLRASPPSLIVFDAPSKPTERTQRSARSPYSLSEYYSTHRHISRRPPSQAQARSTTSTSTSFVGPPLNSVPHPANPHSRTFDSPSKPREYYVRPQRKRDLPELTSRLPIVLLLTALGLSAWGAFILYATNLERLSSSVVRQLCSNLKIMASVKEILGDGVKAEGKWWLGGEPWIDGAVNLLQGNVDVSFRVSGSKGAGIVYFTSVRAEKGQPFIILRSKIICDDGTVLQLTES